MSYARNMLSFSLILAVLACPSPPPGEETAPPSDKAPASERVGEPTIAGLEQEVKALAKTDGCTGSSQCKAAPAGAKACGGPRYWIPYCPLTTDEGALMRKLEELRTAEERSNRDSGMMSDCAMTAEPKVASVNGVCQAVP